MEIRGNSFLVSGGASGLGAACVRLLAAQGGRLAAPAWAAFMREVYERKPAPPDWPRPPGILAIPIDPATGLRAGLGCLSDSIRTEFFIAGTEPTQECPRGGIFP